MDSQLADSLMAALVAAQKSADSGDRWCRRLVR